jgi:pyruvate,water dikinase
MSRLIVPLSEAGMSDLPLVGGKGAQLGAMMQAGLPVPDGFCISTQAFRGGMNEELRGAIVAAYQGLGAGRVAVRSSATAEDLPDASFAGQQDTFLNIADRVGVVDAVQSCWRSLFTERAVAYRRDRGIPDQSVAMAVVVQRMVDAEAAGVLFTINPVTGAMDELVVEAARGLGDKVVSAQVTPDRYRLRRRAPHDVIQREGQDTANVLTPALLAELARLGLTAERLLGRAADIEWAAAGGRTYLLQARAVTAAGPRVPVVRFGSRWNARYAQRRLIFWGNYNLRDTMPYPHPPFSWSFWNYLVLPAIYRASGLLRPEKGEDCDQLPAVADLVDGRLYFNMNVWAGLTVSRPQWLWHWLGDRFGGMLDAELPAILKEVFKSGELVPIKRPFGLGRYLHAMFYTPAGMERALIRMTGEQGWRALERCKQEVEHYRNIDVRILSEEQLIALGRYFATEYVPKSIFPLLASLPALPAAGMLSWLLGRWGLGELFPSLISGVRGNPTMDTALAMWDLAEQAGPEVREVFAREEITRVQEALSKSEAGREFRARMDQFLAGHGHRAVREFDFSCPRWREDPTFVYESVRNYLSHPADQPTPREHYERQLREHEAAKQVVQRALRYHPLRSVLFRRLMRLVESRMPLREAYKFYTLLGLARVRELLLEVGRRQAERGILEKSDDFLFLTIPEAEKIALGELDRVWAREQIALRRREFAMYMRTDPPLVVRSDGKPVTKPVATGQVLMGAAASPGLVRGPARIMFDPTDGALLQRGDILVAKFTDPGWTPLFLTAGGLVMEVGGIISHGAVVAREYGIPAVIGVQHATRILRDGEMLQVDGGTGEVRRLTAATAAV